MSNTRRTNLKKRKKVTADYIIGLMEDLSGQTQSGPRECFMETLNTLHEATTPKIIEMFDDLKVADIWIRAVDFCTDEVFKSRAGGRRCLPKDTLDTIRIRCKESKNPVIQKARQAIMNRPHQVVPQPLDELREALYSPTSDDSDQSGSVVDASQQAPNTETADVS